MTMAPRPTRRRWALWPPRGPPLWHGCGSCGRLWRAGCEARFARGGLARRLLATRCGRVGSVWLDMLSTLIPSARREETALTMSW